MINMKSSESSWHRCRYMVLAVVLLLALTACGNQQEEPLRAPDVEGGTAVSIETAYGALRFPEELIGNLRHIEVTEGDVAVEVFYMTGPEGEKELYRIHYADGQAGTPMGYLITENGEISVSYSMCEYIDDDFANEEERKLYYSMMDAFSVIMNSLYADQNFSETRKVEPVGVQEVKLRYWKVVLPSNVNFKETMEGDSYRVDFFGETSGERIDLYTIGMGDVQGETVLGQYNVNGVQKPIVVQTYSLDAYETWPEENQKILYQMMASVNDVIQQIMSSEHFSEIEAE